MDQGEAGPQSSLAADSRGRGCLGSREHRHRPRRVRAPEPAHLEFPGSGLGGIRPSDLSPRQGARHPGSAAADGSGAGDQLRGSAWRLPPRRLFAHRQRRDPSGSLRGADRHGGRHHPDPPGRLSHPLRAAPHHAGRAHPRQRPRHPALGHPDQTGAHLARGVTGRRGGRRRGLGGHSPPTAHGISSRGRRRPRLRRGHPWRLPLGALLGRGLPGAHSPPRALCRRRRQELREGAGREAAPLALLFPLSSGRRTTRGSGRGGAA